MHDFAGGLCGFAGGLCCAFWAAWITSKRSAWVIPWIRSLPLAAISSIRLLLPNWLVETRQSSPCGGCSCLVVPDRSVSSPCGRCWSVRRSDSSVDPVNDSRGRLRNPCSTTPRASSPPSRRRETFAPIFVYLQTAVPAILRYSQIGCGRAVLAASSRKDLDAGLELSFRVRYKRVLD